MKLNCQPGDIAVLIYDNYFPEDIGKLVEIIEEGEHEWDGEVQFNWYCRSLGGPFKVRIYDDENLFTGLIEDDTEAHIPDAWLKPIRDSDGVDETLTWKELEKV